MLETVMVSDDELTVPDSDSTKKAKVAAAVAATGMTFDFGTSTMGRDHIQTLEDLSYFAKGVAWLPNPKSVSEPRVDTVVVFENLFIVGLRMPPHPVLTDILQKFRVQMHQLTPNAIMQIPKFI
jgi:hypothetical protein